MSRTGRISEDSIPYSDAPRGTCRWCGESILKPDGTVNTRARWHNPRGRTEGNCYYRFRREVWDFHYQTRAYHRNRDRGVCGACGLDTVDFLKQVQRQAEDDPCEYVTMRFLLKELGFDVHWRRSRPTMWHVDHVVPLKDGGRHVPENTWTLCVPCHKAKTAEESRRRAGLCEAFRGSEEYQALRAPKSISRAARDEHGRAWEAFRARYLPPRDPMAAKAYWEELLCQTRS